MHHGTYTLNRPLTIRRKGTLIGCALGDINQISDKVKVRVNLPDQQPGPLSLVTFDDASTFKLFNCSICLNQLDQVQLTQFDAERYFCLVQGKKSFNLDFRERDINIKTDFILILARSGEGNNVLLLKFVECHNLLSRGHESDFRSNRRSIRLIQRRTRQTRCNPMNTTRHCL